MKGWGMWTGHPQRLPLLLNAPDLTPVSGKCLLLFIPTATFMSRGDAQGPPDGSPGLPPALLSTQSWWITPSSQVVPSPRRLQTQLPLGAGK